MALINSGARAPEATDKSAVRQQAAEILTEKLKDSVGGTIHPGELSYISWPEAFSSTAGPFGGVGGQAFTTFQLDAFDYDGHAAIFCNGRFIAYCPDFNFQTSKWNKRG